MVKSDQDQKKGKEPDLDEREKKLAAREAALEKGLKELNIMRTTQHDFQATETAVGKSTTLSEISSHPSVEMVQGDDLIKQIDLEAFMNELVTIMVYTDGTSGALEVVCPTVNGVNQPIIRGRDQVIKRKYVEVLARSKITTYRQEVVDQSRPENIQMTPIANMTAPFVIREDRNPKGRAWLEQLLAQPA